MNTVQRGKEAALSIKGDIGVYSNSDLLKCLS